MTFKEFLQLWCANILIGAIASFIGYVLFVCAYSLTCNVLRMDKGIFLYGAISTAIIYPLFILILFKSEAFSLVSKRFLRLLLYLFTGPVCAFIASFIGFLIYRNISGVAGVSLFGLSLKAALRTLPISIFLAGLVVHLNIVFLENKNSSRWHNENKA